MVQQGRQGAEWRVLVHKLADYLFRVCIRLESSLQKHTQFLPLKARSKSLTSMSAANALRLGGCHAPAEDWDWPELMRHCHASDHEGLQSGRAWVLRNGARKRRRDAGVMQVGE